ncbi:MAG: hypothetical protein AUK00_01640 [Dehalococcoidia bacterium CG2_30_46_9]|nr:MAG: hypothetical protein AUK00_01640 [Dehalococcoidia bacterium CG2_30_46_9]
MTAELRPPPNLDDLADVSVPLPGSQYFLYWDDATSLWKCKALAATDIPSLDAAKIASGRFGMPRMPDGTSGLVLTAQGTGVDPVYTAGEDSYARILAWLGV